MGRSRYKVFNHSAPHFLTCTVVNWLPIFGHPSVTQIVFDSLTFLQRERRLLIYGYVIMENHLHLVASSSALAKEIGDFKSYTARTIVEKLKQEGRHSLLAEFHAHKLAHRDDRPFQIWQEGSHPEEIFSEEMLRQKLEYIHNNPVRRGYVADPLHWRYSSAANYAGEAGLISVETQW